MNARRILASFLTLALVGGLPAGAANDKQLRTVRGVVGHQTDAAGEFKRVIGQLVLPDDDLAVTRENANGLLTLPDSSEVALGPNTSVKVGAFNEPTSPNPTTITLQNGSLRFAVKRPTGGKSNYRFVTTSSQIAVRGTIGLVATAANGDTIACLACEPGDVLVTVGAKTYPLLTGQTLFVSLAGVVTAGAVSAAVLQGFSTAGLSTSATSTTAFAPGIASGAGAGAGAGASAAAVAGHAASAGLLVGGAAAAAVGVTAISNANKSTPAPAAAITPAPTPSPSPSPVGGTAQLKSLTPPTATPSPAPSHHHP